MATCSRCCRPTPCYHGNDRTGSDRDDVIASSIPEVALPHYGGCGTISTRCSPSPYCCRAKPDIRSMGRSWSNGKVKPEVVEHRTFPVLRRTSRPEAGCCSRRCEEEFSRRNGEFSRRNGGFSRQNREFSRQNGGFSRQNCARWCSCGCCGGVVERSSRARFASLQPLLVPILALLVLVECCGLTTLVGATRLPDIYWNTTNPMFRVDNTDHVIDIQIGDTVDIVCPKYTTGSSSSTSTSGALSSSTDYMEQHTIYQVTREEYEMCRVLHLDRSITRKILTCNSPLRDKMYTIVFRTFTPVPQGLEFTRGTDYYYISTSKHVSPSAASGLSAEGGETENGCRRYNMRMVFKICCSTSTKAPPTSPAAHPDTVTSQSHHGIRHHRHKAQQQQQHEQNKQQEEEEEEESLLETPRRTPTTADDSDDERPEILQYIDDSAVSLRGVITTALTAITTALLITTLITL